MKQVDEFSNLVASRLPRERLEIVRECSKVFHEKMKNGPQIKYYQSLGLIRVPYPTKYGFGGAYSGWAPYLHIVNRVFIGQFYQGRDLKTILISPSDVEGNAETPFFKNLRKSFGAFQDLGTKIMAPKIRSVESALEEVGISPAQVDFISYDHLHTQDLRKWLGTSENHGFFPNAKLLVSEKEWRSAKALLPPQKRWYCPNGIDGIPDERIIMFDKDLMLGDGIALILTPGHTMGNHSFVVNTADGVIVTSENGIGVDAYAPEMSMIPGLKEFALETKSEVILNSNTLESGLQQYISMVQEKEMASPLPGNPNFPFIACSSEFASYWAFPGLRPTCHIGEFKYGEQTNVSNHGN